MGVEYNMDVNNHSPQLEIASAKRPQVFVGHSILDASTLTCSSAKLLVRGKVNTPLAQRNSLGQSLLVSGQDRRSRVLDTSYAPWKMICSLKISSKDGSEFIGSGWIAGPRLIITAGHCVFHNTYGGWAEKIIVIPGRDGDEEPFGSYTSSTFHSVSEWVNCGDENNDIGAIILDEDIGSTLGHFSFGAYDDNFLKSQLINISGYPGSAYGEEQMHHANRINDVTTYKLYYDVDTEGGQSGSPIWIYTDTNADPVVVGVHSNGAGLSYNANSGVRISHTLAEQIAKWRAIK